MKKSNLAAASAAVAGAFVWSSAVNAAVFTEFTYSGETDVESNVNTFNDFPAGGVFRSDDGSEGADSFGTIVGTGTDTPNIEFANGATATGDTTAFSTTTVKIDITNDEAFAQQVNWNFFIFGGGTGIVQPNLFSSGCIKFQLDICDSFIPAPDSHGASAMLEFGVTFDGMVLFSGEIFVDASTQTFDFQGISLDGFTQSPGNGQFFTWQDTAFSQDLGIFSAGETKTLEFFVSANVASSANDPCFFDPIDTQTIDCPLAMAGFGDPEDADMGGGVIMQAFSLPFDFEDSFDMDPPDVPVPGAVWLFLTGLGGLFGARKLKKSA